MKSVVFLSLLMALSFCAYAQYDSAIRYRMSSPTYYQAMDTLILRAATNPADTTEGGQANQLARAKYFYGSRICADVSVGAAVLPMLGLTDKSGFHGIVMNVIQTLQAHFIC